MFPLLKKAATNDKLGKMTSGLCCLLVMDNEIAEVPNTFP